MSLETLSEATERLRKAGYVESFRAEEGGLRALGTRQLYAPEDLAIDEVVRFEGVTDPGDEAILFALRAADGVLGTYAAAYGTSVAAADAAVVSRLDTQEGRGGRRRERP